MTVRRLRAFLCVSLLSLGVAPRALALANRVFASARSGNDANSCDNINTPCQTLAGAVTQVNPDGEVIVLDSGGYGPVTITKGVTIEASAGVTAFIHPPSGDAVTVNAPGATVTLRGLTLNVGNNGIEAQAVGTLHVEKCLITGFVSNGIHMGVAGNLIVKDTDVKTCQTGIAITNTSGMVIASIDHCHLDGNAAGFGSVTISPGGSTTTATYTTANNNTDGWVSGDVSNGVDILNLESCTASGNFGDGLFAGSTNASSRVRFSNSVFSNNGGFGVKQSSADVVESRGNNTITGNTDGPTSGTIGSFLPI